jgi:hypothetical protein
MVKSFPSLGEVRNIWANAMSRKARVSRPEAQGSEATAKLARPLALSGLNGDGLHGKAAHLVTPCSLLWEIHERLYHTIVAALTSEVPTPSHSRSRLGT